MRLPVIWVTICTVSDISQNSTNTAEKVPFCQIQEGIGETDNFWCRQSLQDERDPPPPGTLARKIFFVQSEEGITNAFNTGSVWVSARKGSLVHLDFVCSNFASTYPVPTKQGRCQDFSR